MPPRRPCLVAVNSTNWFTMSIIRKVVLFKITEDLRKETETEFFEDIQTYFHKAMAKENAQA